MLPHLAESIVNEDAERIIQEHPAIASLEDGLNAIISFALKNRKAAMHIYHSINRDKSIEDFFSDSFFESSMWLCFHSCLAFKRYHSALECRRYFQRFSFIVRHEYLEGIIHTKYNEHDAMILPLLRWLEGKGVQVAYGCSVYDLTLDAPCNTVEAIHLRRDGNEETVSVNAQDLVFVTNGSMVTNSAFGDKRMVSLSVRATKSS